MACARARSCGAPITTTVVGSFAIPVAQTAQALFVEAAEALDSRGWLCSSGSAATRHATRRMNGVSRRSICSVNSYHESGKSCQLSVVGCRSSRTTDNRQPTTNLARRELLGRPVPGSPIHERRRFPRPPLWLNLLLLVLAVGTFAFARYQRDEISRKTAVLFTPSPSNPTELNQIRDELSQMDVTEDQLKRELDARMEYLKTVESSQFYLSVDTQKK